jgi:hypothetical protein
MYFVQAQQDFLERKHISYDDYQAYIIAYFGDGL